VAAIGSRAPRLITTAVLLLTCSASMVGATSSNDARQTLARPSLFRTSSGERARAVGPIRRTVILGRSVDGRPIIGIETGDPASPRKVLVVGCVHGNECAGEAITSRLLELRPPASLDLWIIPNLNPDGAARGTRGNAHGVDLNRNFPWHWQPLDGVYYSGPHPLSEPEARIAYSVIRRLRPVVSIWFHQHLDLIDESGGNPTIETRFARLVRLPLARLAREPGSITSWENHTIPGTAFVVELPAGHLQPATAERFARAILTISAVRRRPRSNR
jgi:protein MpaA